MELLGTWHSGRCGCHGMGLERGVETRSSLRSLQTLGLCHSVTGTAFGLNPTLVCMGFATQGFLVEFFVCFF